MPLVGFVLPGRVYSDKAYKKFLYSASAAFSRSCNPRNLEAPWYEVWEILFTDLVADSVHLAVSPQYRLWYIENDNSNAADSDEGEDPIEELILADTTLNSIALSETANDTSRLPDFIITRKVALRRNAPYFPGSEYRIQHVGIPLLCEIKPSGPRCRSQHTGLKGASDPMLMAQSQLLQQADCLFRMEQHSQQNSVILIAATGYWWTYRIVHRGEDLISNVDVGFDYVPDIDRDEQMDEQLSDDFMEDEDNNSYDEDSLVPYGDLDDFKNPMQKLAVAADNDRPNQDSDESIPILHPILADDETLKDDTNWSPFLLIESQASNQVLHLIHDMLLDIARDFADYTRG